MMPRKHTERSVDRATWYDRNAEPPQHPESKVKISSKGKGQLADGYTKLSTPEDKTGKPLQLKSERDRVGAKWPGPGKMLHAKASPASRESFLRQAKNKEFSAK